MRHFKISVAFLFLLLSSLSFAQDSPEEVEVSLYLIDVSKYDVTTGEFAADFYLGLYCQDDCDPTNFEFMNGRETSLDMSIDTPEERFYRIQGVFGSSVNLEKYPFDEQKIQLVMEDKLKTTDELVYGVIENESGIDESIVFHGWEIKNWSVVVDEHYYPPYDETYSRYTFTVEIERIKLNALLKTFVPLFSIIIITLASLFLTPKEMGFRITIVGSTLITTVLLHLSILSEIPPTPYLTFIDKFMFVTYVILLLSFLVNISILALREKNRPVAAQKVHRFTEKMVLLVPLVYILLFYILLS